MKHLYALVTMLLLATCGSTSAQPIRYTVTVEAGHGSGLFEAGDTVHVFARAMNANEVFGEWTSNNGVAIERSTEWHTTFVMPAADVTVRASYRSIDAFTLQLEQIAGVNNDKNVYHHFPAGMRGVVFLYHGSGGSARGWLPTSVENYQLVKDLVADSFGVIVTESEETTLNRDLNNDQKIRWYVSAPIMDSSIDYRNLRVIVDKFISRGTMSTTTALFGVGMSNGGAFSIPAGSVLNMKAAVSYCASGRAQHASVITMPVMWCMAQNDDNENVGEEGNAEALVNHQRLMSRGIDSRYLIREPYPIYPEIFVRYGATPEASRRMVLELDTNGLLNDSKIMRASSDSMAQFVLANPGRFPFISSQSGAASGQVLNALSAAYAEHKFYAGYNRATIDFLKTHTEDIVSSVSASADSMNRVDNARSSTSHFNVYPNPAGSDVTVESAEPIQSLVLIDAAGRTVFESQGNNQRGINLNASSFPAGVYLIRLRNAGRLACTQVLFIHK